MLYAMIVTMNSVGGLDAHTMDFNMSLADCYAAMVAYEPTAITMNYGLGCISQAAYEEILRTESN